MKKNKFIFKIAVLLVPFVVVSFVFNDKTNFYSEDSPISIVNLKEERTSTNKTVKEDEPIYVRLLLNGKVVNIELEEYIVGVVAGEMPASFGIEALKAQAVASRSYALYRKKTSNKSYDLTADINSQVYVSVDTMKRMWGSEFEKYYNKVKKAVYDTKGIVATYDGKIIEALYSAISSGMTQDVKNVFGGDVAYLKSVPSEYDNGSISEYKRTRKIDKTVFKNTLKLSCDNISIDYVNKYDNGYINKISICGKVFSGEQVRNTIGLRSSNFDIKAGDIIEITTYGYGHCVGMSQYGANGYASIGYNYEDIIKHYYQNVEIMNIKNV